MCWELDPNFGSWTWFYFTGAFMWQSCPCLVHLPNQASGFTRGVEFGSGMELHVLYRHCTLVQCLLIKP